MGKKMNNCRCFVELTTIFFVCCRTAIERYFQHDPAMLEGIKKMEEPLLEIRLLTNDHERREVKAASYVLAEKKDISNTPEVEDDLRGVLEFLCDTELPECDSYGLHFSDLRGYSKLDHERFQAYTKFPYEMV